MKKIKKHKKKNTAYDLGVVLFNNQQYDEAIVNFQRALELNPKLLHAYNYIGNALQEKKKYDEAISYYKKALALNPYFIGAHYNLGDAFLDKGQLDKAIACYQQAIKLDPYFAHAYNNLAIALKDKGQIDEAIIYCKKAIELDPNLVEAIYNMGNALYDKGQLDEAMTYYQKALQLNPNHAGAYTNLGNVFKSRGEVDKAEMFYRYAMQMNPDDLTPYQALLMTINYNYSHDAQTIFSEHLLFAKKFAEPLYPEILKHTNDHVPGRRLKIGYVSPDFGKHSVAYFIEPILAAHNKERFETFCYSVVPQEDEVTQRLQGYADHWRGIAVMSGEEAAELIRNDAIDILVDLAGHTAYNRLLLFARKPAPVQITWIGYPATTGLSTMDYKIVDSYTDPPGMTEQF
ncbi:MAG: tetratricopeptide repeat protein, partial [Nitrospira sp.]|nr:tetratricopeptide repeat protein [Nitrospira sp.]